MAGINLIKGMEGVKLLRLRGVSLLQSVITVYGLVNVEGAKAKTHQMFTLQRVD